ncbi:hypothetical protein Tco_0785881 [Tanacetum coccineum]
MITNHGSQTNPIVSVRGKENGLPNSHQLNQGSFELEPQGILFGLPLRRCSSWTITASYFNDDLSDRRRKKHTKQMPSNQYCASGLPKDIQSSSITTLKQKQFGQNTSKWPFSQVKKHQMSTMFRFHKLSHDMRIIRMTMPNIQLNSKFVNNMSPEWDSTLAQDRLIIERITPTTNDQLAFVSTFQPYAQSSHVQSHQYPSSLAAPQSPHIQSLQHLQFPKTSQIDSGHTQTDEILDNLTKQMALLPNPSEQHFLRQTINFEPRLTPEIKQLFKKVKENRSSVITAMGLWTTIANKLYSAKRPTKSDYLQDKMLLMQAQENGAVLDEKELLFLAGEQANTFDADECDAFDSDVNDEPTAQSIFMANLSSARPANLQAGPSNASIISEVPILENVIDHSVTNQDEHEIHNEEQHANIIDSTTEDMGNCNVIPYEQYLSINNISVVPSCASSVLNDACVLSDNDANVPHDPIATELNIYKEQVAIYEQRAKFELTEREQRMDDQMRAQNPFYLRQAKKVQPALYDGKELLKTHHVPVIVPSSEEDLELAEITKIKMHEKMNDSVSVEKRMLEKRRPRTKANAHTPAILNHLRLVYTTHTPVHLVLQTLPTTSSLNIVCKHLLRLEVDNLNLQLKYQHLKDRTETSKSRTSMDAPEFDAFFELNEKNAQLQTHKNIILKLKAQISQLKDNKSDVSGTLLPQPLESQNFQLHGTINKLQKENDCFRAENSKIKQHYKELYDSIKITRATHIENITSLLNEIETLKTQVKGKMPVITNETVIPKVSVCNKYAIDVEPIPPTQRNNRNVQQGYLNCLKDTLDTLCEIVEEARSKRTSDNSLEYACIYTKTSQELLENVIASCPKTVNKKDR